jgi:hypothetical protein
MYIRVTAHLPRACTKNFPLIETEAPAYEGRGSLSGSRRFCFQTEDACH